MRSSPQVFALLAALAAPAIASAQTGSTVAIDPLGRGTWIADEERDEVTLAGEDGESKRIPVGRWPEQLVVKSDGTVFVSCRGDRRIDVIDPHFETHHIPVGTEPRALALDGDRLYAGLVTERAIALVDTNTFKLIAHKPTEIAPTSLAVTPAGVAFSCPKNDAVHFLPAGLDGAETAVALRSPKGSKRTPWHVQSLVSAGDRLLVLHALVDTGLSAPASGGGYGGSVMSPINMAVSVIDTPASPETPALRKLIGMIEVQDARGAAFDGKFLFVASRATKQLVVAGLNLEKQTMSPSEALNLGEGVSGVALAPDGSVQTFVAFERSLARVSLHPKAERILWSTDHFDNGTNSIATGQIEMKMPIKLAGRVSISESKLDEELRLGRALFHDGVNFRISENGMACISCHPDGREDGLVWRLRGMRRQTPMLSSRLADTAPYNWEGTTATLEKNIDQTIQRLGGGGLEPKETHALARYLLEGIRPTDRPAAQETPLVARGRALFESSAVGCASCHTPGAYTDGEKYDVESTSKTELEEMRAATLVRVPSKMLLLRRVIEHAEKAPQQANITPQSLSEAVIRGMTSGASLEARQQAVAALQAQRKRALTVARAQVKAPEYNTPSLRFLALTAPYLHDGSAATLEELIAKNDDRMGHTSELGDEDRRALVAYLYSI